MKTLLKKGTRQINQEKREECLKNWGTIAYSNSSKLYCYPSKSAGNCRSTGQTCIKYTYSSSYYEGERLD